ncbi:SPOR domain-containing protein [Phaeovulum sp.]|uniref:SPOR domain-containing protein n=1 Tax=Phaeovulum sp. TaxID=2934796 RepID=UPI002731E2EB|nr:SPOR domain-containing protein [Phaeovulum sp.]MDP1670091.1 SPOR domain-containing protein [Phaeovulum sp.]MDZ4118333.1 SPOR domain-containing protein [Phaeovulum sp.]
MTRARIGWMVAVLATGLGLSGCGEGGRPFGGGEGAAPVAEVSTRLVERDVEAPDVFSLTDQGLWDGRPSLGGVWVADASVTSPERVIIRNSGNGKFVIGALFRREREAPGPRVQVSSDAAAALGMLAGQPAALSVIALRREEVAPEVPAAAAAPAPVTGAPGTITATPLGDVTSTAAAAIAAAEAAPAAASTAAPARALTQAYVQIGIFSVEANANRAAEQIRAAGLGAVVKKESSHGKTFWRVIAGPAASAAERGPLLAKVKALGYADAYAVSN